MRYPREAAEGETVHLDAVIVGAGFAGLYMLHRLRELGLKAKVLEAGGGVGGTWYWNRYPGARCDIESVEYSYSFDKGLEQDWTWSERYASQSEILRYLEHVADRFDLRGDILLNTRVASAVFDETANRWNVTTEGRDRFSARYCVMATGTLSAPKAPELPGLETFAGETYQTGRWPHEKVSFSGKRVGVIGTGSSGIQSIPVIAEEAEHLFVFQRTPSFSVPANNTPLEPEAVRQVKETYGEIRRDARAARDGISWPWRDVRALDETPEAQCQALERRWNEGGLAFLRAYGDTLESREANDVFASFVRAKIRDIVDDPITAEQLTPKDYPLGAKRLCVDTGYYATYNRDNVTLVDVKRSPIQRVTSDGLQTEDACYALDTLVLATGFDAMTGSLLRVDIRGRGGLPLREKWTAGPRTYLGLMSAGFPNLFIITGPGSPSVLSNMVVSIEQHVEWIAACVRHLDESQEQTIEPQREAEDAWVAHVNDEAETTLFLQANSWYLGANVPGKPRIFMPYPGGVGKYREICDAVVRDGYRGFTLIG